MSVRGDHNRIRVSDDGRGAFDTVGQTLVFAPRIPDACRRLAERIPAAANTLISRVLEAEDVAKDVVRTAHHGYTRLTGLALFEPNITVCHG